MRLFCEGNLRLIRSILNVWWNIGPRDCAQIACSTWSKNSANPTWMIANTTGFLLILFISSNNCWYGAVKFAFFTNTINLDSSFTLPIIFWCYITPVVDRTSSHSSRKCDEQHTSGPGVNKWSCDVVGLEGRHHRRLFAAWYAFHDVMIRPNTSRICSLPVVRPSDHNVVAQFYFGVIVRSTWYQ